MRHVNTILTKMIKYKAVIALVAVFAFGALVSPNVSMAQGDTFGIERVQQGLDGSIGDRPLIETITGIIKIGLSLLGIIAVCIILAGGFKWMTAGGNENKVGEARKMIISGVIGLAIIMSAFAIANFVIGSLATQTGADQDQPLPEGL